MSRISLSGAASRFPVSTFIFGAALSLAAPALAEDQGAAGMAKFVILAVKDNSARLQRGIYHAHGHLDRSHEPEFPIEGDVVIFCAFDFPSSRIRFDRQGPIWRLPPAGRPAEAVLGEEAAKAIWDGDKVTTWVPLQRRVNIRRAGRAPLAAARYFDIRLLGLFNWATVEADGITYESQQQEISRAPSEVARESDGTIKLSWVDRPNKLRRDVWFDAKLGACPVRVEIRTLLAPEKWADAMDRSRVTWAQQEGAWVPIAVSHERLIDPKRRLDLIFDWDSVNSAVDAANFQLAALQLPQKTQVVDFTLGRPILTTPARGTRVTELRNAARSDPVQGRSRTFAILLVLNVGLLALLVGLFVWRHRTRK